MTDFDKLETAFCGEPFKVAVMPTEDGEKIVIIFAGAEGGQTIFWLEPSGGVALAEALIGAARLIKNEGTDHPTALN